MESITAGANEEMKTKTLKISN